MTSAERIYLAFDLGASSGRGILGFADAAGNVRLEEVHRFPNGPMAADGGVFWDFDALFEHVLEAMRLVAGRGVVPRAIGMDTWGVDFALLDESSKLLDRPRCYRDGRNAGIAARVAERIGKDRLQERGGSMLQDHASLCQLLAVKENTPDLLARAKRLVFIPDLLRYWLCGGEEKGLDSPAAGTDITAASTSLAYDVPARQWCTELLAELDLPAGILPPVGVGPTVVGTLGGAIQQKTGLPAVPVVAGAGHDTGAAFGLCTSPPVGGIRGGVPPLDDTVIISAGTWSILGMMLGGRLPPGTLDPARYGYEANPDGSLRLVRNLVGGWLLEQCRKAWREAGMECSYATLIAAARSAAGTPGASAILDAQSEEFTHPANMPEAIVAHCRRTSQPAPATVGEFAQVIFASLAETYAQAIDELREVLARPLRNVYMLGGLSQNAYVNELTEKTANVRVIVGPSEATALGNLAIQIAAVP